MSRNFRFLFVILAIVLTLSAMAPLAQPTAAQGSNPPASAADTPAATPAAPNFVTPRLVWDAPLASKPQNVVNLTAQEQAIAEELVNTLATDAKIVAVKDGKIMAEGGLSADTPNLIVVNFQSIAPDHIRVMGTFTSTTTLMGGEWWVLVGPLGDAATVKEITGYAGIPWQSFSVAGSEGWKTPITQVGVYQILFELRNNLSCNETSAQTAIGVYGLNSAGNVEATRTEVITCTAAPAPRGCVNLWLNGPNAADMPIWKGLLSNADGTGPTLEQACDRLKQLPRPH